MAARPEVGGEVAQLGLEAGERLEGADDMALEDMPKGDAEFAGHGAFVAAAARFSWLVRV